MNLKEIFKTIDNILDVDIKDLISDLSDEIYIKPEVYYLGNIKGAKMYLNYINDIIGNNISNTFYVGCFITSSGKPFVSIYKLNDSIILKFVNVVDEFSFKKMTSGETLEFMKDVRKKILPTVESKKETTTSDTSIKTVYDRLKGNTFLALLVSDTTEQFTTSRVTIDGADYGVLYLKDPLYSQVLSKYETKDIKIMNTTLKIVKCSLTEFSETLNNLHLNNQEPRVTQSIRISSDLSSNVNYLADYFNSLVENKTMTIVNLVEFMIFISKYDGSLELRFYDEKPSHFISFETTQDKTEILNINICNSNVEQYKPKHIFNMFTFLKLHFGL